LDQRVEGKGKFADVAGTGVGVENLVELVGLFAGRGPDNAAFSNSKRILEKVVAQ